jgi:hypothetical protein
MAIIGVGAAVVCVCAGLVWMLSGRRAKDDLGFVSSAWTAEHNLEKHDG